ncbi:hypothetical protein BLA24064_02521 [Burkholderia latens]|uniref:Uncharacterized protein n=1 Tax=Burkholderia latens TaxID=488446 RepID=A0A6P2KEH7_9BURK|nr:hypothetical protein BLA24064_02521 [Burkholderia latens]
MCRAGMPAGVIGQKQAETMHAVQVPSNADGMRGVESRSGLMVSVGHVCAGSERI